MTLDALRLRRRQCFWLWVCGTATAALLMIAPSAAADSFAPKLPAEPFLDRSTEPIALAPHPQNVVRTPAPCAMVPPHDGNDTGRTCSRATTSGG